MAIVTEIRENKGLTELSLDGIFWLRVRKKHCLQLQLETNSSIDPDEIMDRLAALQADDCYEAALTVLDQSAQTRANLVRKLTQKGFVRPAAEAAAQRLTENRLIDDRRFAERIAQSQLNKSIGAYSVRRKLRTKLLSEEDVDAAMECFDEAQQIQACRDAAEKLWRKYGRLPPREGRAKLSQALARRGFGWEIIRSTVEEISTDWDDFEY